MKKPLRLSPLAMTAALAALAALLLPLAGQEVLHTLAPLVLALLLGLAAALGWDRPNRPSHPRTGRKACTPAAYVPSRRQ